MTGKTVALTMAENGRRIDLARGDQVVLRLHEVAGTGYLWAFEDLDATLVEARQDPAPQGKELAGGGSDVQWTITAKSKGATVLRLKLWRHWEGEPSVRERFALRLNIRE